MYKIKKNIFMNKETIIIIKKNENGSESSFGEWLDNADYQEYLKWLEEGNTPLPAENN